MRLYFLALSLLFPLLAFSQPECNVNYPSVPEDTDFVAFVRAAKSACSLNTLTITVAEGSSIYNPTESLHPEIGPPTNPAESWTGFNLIIKSTSSEILPTYRSKVSLQFGKLNSVTLMNMGFSLTRNPHVNKANSFSIINCAFFEGYGMKQSPADSKYPVFVQNSRFEKLVMVGKDTNSFHGYSAIFAEGAPVTVEDSVFSGIQGRAVKAEKLSSVRSYYDSNILNIEWEDPPRGGALFAVNDITLTGNFFIANKAGYGGAVYSKLGSIASATGNTFIGNVAFGFPSNNNIYGVGGAIYAAKSFNLGENNHFELNQCTNLQPTTPQIGGAGGAIAIFSSTIMGLSSVSGSNNTFKSNEAALGGAIYTTGSLTSNGGKYQNNKVSGIPGTVPTGKSPALPSFPSTGNYGGGAVYLKHSLSTFSSTNDLFDGNQANSVNSNGGAVYATGSIQTVSSVFQLNTAEANGGSIYSTGSIELSGGSIKSSTAQSGGGIYSASYVTSSASISFEDNEATEGEGGAIVATYVSLINPVFSGNKGTAAGQAISFSEDSEITSGSFTENLEGSGGYHSLSVPNGKQLKLLGLNTFTDSNIILNGNGQIMKSGADVEIFCDSTTKKAFGSDQFGFTSCKESSESPYTQILFTTTSEGTTHDLNDLWAAVRGIVSLDLQSKNLYVDWTNRVTDPRRSIEVHDATATFVLPFDSATPSPSDSYKWAYNLQQSGESLEDEGFIVQFGDNATNIYAKQLLTTNECAYQDSNACNNNGYCVEPGSQGIGYCDCMSGYSQLQCTDLTPLRESEEVTFGSLNWMPKLFVLFHDDTSVAIKVIVQSQDNAHQDEANFATTTFLRFGGSKKDCNYPRNEEWELSTKQWKGNWYDHYTQTFTFSQLKECGLAPVNPENTRYLFFNNTLDIERNYVSKQGARFHFERKARTRMPFSLMFPKTVSATTNIRVWNTTIEFFATVSQLKYMTENSKWHMKITTVIANKYQLRSTFVNGDTSPTTPPFSDRNFQIIADSSADPKLPQVDCNTNGECQQTFYFVFDNCKGFTIEDYVFSFDVQCQPSEVVPYCLLPEDATSRVVSFTLNAETNEKGSCPIDTTFNPGAVMNSYDSGLIATKTLFGMSETAYFAVDFASPIEIQSISIASACVHKTAQSVGVLCTTNTFTPTEITGDRKGHRVAFSILAKTLMDITTTVGSGTVVVQADLTIVYGEGMTQKRSVMMELPHSGTSVISIIDRNQKSLLLGEKMEDQGGAVPSSASFFSSSVALVLVAFFAF